MKEEAYDALASDGGRSPTPGDRVSSVFRESGGYRKAVAVAAICASMSVGLILMDHTGVMTPKSDDVRPTVLAFPGLRYGLPVNSVHSADDLMAQLKAHQLWEMPPDNRITPIIFTNYPADFDSLDVETKKKAFLHALLPEALLARAEIARERKALEKILAKFEEPDRLAFDDEEESAWKNRLTNSEIQFIDYLVGKYRSRKAINLLTRVDTFPASLILAQAALESSWGSSRFAEQGNNIFGLWTWGKKGLVPTDRDADKDHKVATYDTILGSVRAYLLTLNRLPAYRRLRQLRRNTRDPLLLAEGLHRYSERGMDYVAELKQIIRYNQLERYDYCRLADLPGGSISDFKISRL